MIIDVLTEEIQAAEKRIRPFLRETWLESSLPLSKMTGGDVRLKLDNGQHTGSFKVRGALNKVFSLEENRRLPGVVAASTGNHGVAVSYAAQKAGVPAVVFAPETAHEDKLRMIRAMGVTIHTHGTECLDAEKAARRFADEQGMTFISPYNDLKVIAGQGTLGVEIARQFEDVEAVLVAVGGGGLIAGIGAWMKSVNPDIQIIGCSPEKAPVMEASVKAGEIVELPYLPTLSDATAGGLEPGAITFDLCRRLVDRWVSVTEEEIARFMTFVMGWHHQLIEGAAAVPVAVVEKIHDELEGKRVAVVICGGNVGLNVIKKILN